MTMDKKLSDGREKYDQTPITNKPQNENNG